MITGDIRSQIDRIWTRSGAGNPLEVIEQGTDHARFLAKARAFLREHLDHVAIRKLRMNKPLTVRSSRSSETPFRAARNFKRRIASSSMFRITTWHATSLPADIATISREGTASAGWPIACQEEHRGDVPHRTSKKRRTR